MDSFQCDQCNRHYSSSSSLSHHIRNQHPSEYRKRRDDVVAKNGRVTCADCGASLASRYSLDRHGLAKHPDRWLDAGQQSHAVVATSLCCEDGCSFAAPTCKALRHHLQTEHCFRFRTVEREFVSFQDFQSWKSDFELVSGAQFVSVSGRRLNKDGTETRYYFCNRSGTERVSISPPERKRKRTKKGSCKLGRNCTAEMIVKVYPDERTHLKAFTEHYGHAIQLEHMRVPDSHRERIAGRLMEGMQWEELLDSQRAVSPDIRDLLAMQQDSVENVSTRLFLMSSQELRNLQPSLSVGYAKGWNELDPSHPESSDLNDVDVLEEQEAFSPEDVSEADNSASRRDALLDLLGEADELTRQIPRLDDEVFLATTTRLRECVDLLKEAFSENNFPSFETQTVPPHADVTNGPRMTPQKSSQQQHVVVYFPSCS